MAHQIYPKEININTKTEVFWVYSGKVGPLRVIVLQPGFKVKRDGVVGSDGQVGNNYIPHNCVWGTKSQTQL